MRISDWSSDVCSSDLRRLNAAPMTKSFVSRHKRDGYVAENHVIVLEPTSDTPAVSQEVLARLLNSEVVNTRFSAVSGSFSVSRSEEHTSELQSLMRISYAVFCLKKKKKQNTQTQYQQNINKIGVM